MPSDLDLSDEEEEEEKSSKEKRPSLISPDAPLTAVSLTLNVIQGDGLVAKDKNILGQWTTSDPYVLVSCFPMGLEGPEIKLGKSHTIRYTLSPKWNEDFSIELPVKSVTDDLQFQVTIMDWDEDLIPGMVQSDDDLMGVVAVNVPPSLYNRGSFAKSTKWYGVPATSASRASGRIQCTLDVKTAQKKRDDIARTVVKEPTGGPILNQATYKPDEEKEKEQLKKKSFFASSSKKDKSSSSSKDKDGSKHNKRGMFGLKRSPSKMNVTAPPASSLEPPDLSKLKVTDMTTSTRKLSMADNSSTRNLDKTTSTRKLSVMEKATSMRRLNSSDKGTSSRNFFIPREGSSASASSSRLLVSDEDVEADQKTQLNQILAKRNLQRNKDTDSVVAPPPSLAGGVAPAPAAPDGHVSILNLGAAYAANKDDMKSKAQQELEKQRQQAEEDLKLALGYDPPKEGAGDIYAMAVQASAPPRRGGRPGLRNSRTQRSSSVSHRSSRSMSMSMNSQGDPLSLGDAASMSMGAAAAPDASASATDLQANKVGRPRRANPYGSSGDLRGKARNGSSGDLSTSHSRRGGLTRSTSVRSHSNRNFDYSTDNKASGRDRGESGPPITGMGSGTRSSGDLMSGSRRTRGMRRSTSSRSSRNFNYSTENKASGKDKENSGPPITGMGSGSRSSGDLMSSSRGGRGVRRSTSQRNSRTINGAADHNKGGSLDKGGAGGLPIPAAPAAQNGALAGVASSPSLMDVQNSVGSASASKHKRSSDGDLSKRPSSRNSVGSTDSRHKRASAGDVPKTPKRGASPVRLSTNSDSLALMRKNIQKNQDRAPTPADRMKSPAPPSMLNAVDAEELKARFLATANDKAPTPADRIKSPAPPRISSGVNAEEVKAKFIPPTPLMMPAPPPTHPPAQELPARNGSLGSQAADPPKAPIRVKSLGDPDPPKPPVRVQTLGDPDAPNPPPAGTPTEQQEKLQSQPNRALERPKSPVPSRSCVESASIKEATAARDLSPRQKARSSLGNSSHKRNSNSPVPTRSNVESASSKEATAARSLSPRQQARSSLGNSSHKRNSNSPVPTRSSDASPSVNDMAKAGSPAQRQDRSSSSHPKEDKSSLEPNDPSNSGVHQENLHQSPSAGGNSESKEPTPEAHDDDESMGSFAADDREDNGDGETKSKSDVNRKSSSSPNNSRSNFEAYLNHGEGFKSARSGSRSKSDLEGAAETRNEKEEELPKSSRHGRGRRSGSEHQRSVTPPNKDSLPRSSDHRGRMRRDASEDFKKDSPTTANAQSSPRSVGDGGIDPENPPGFYMDADGNEYYLSNDGKEYYKDPVTGGYYEDGYGSTGRQDNDFGFYVDAEGRDYFLDERGKEHYKDDEKGDGEYGFFIDGGGREYFLDEFGVEHFKEDDLEPEPDVAETGFFLDLDGMEYYLDSKGLEYYKNPMDGEFYTHPFQDGERGQRLNVKELPAKDRRDWEARRRMKQ